jgi:hypothetical protein
MSQTGPLKRSFDSDDGIEFVRCRICGDYRRVISGRHLSKHDTWTILSSAARPARYIGMNAKEIELTTR